MKVAGSLRGPLVKAYLFCEDRKTKHTKFLEILVKKPAWTTNSVILKPLYLFPYDCTLCLGIDYVLDLVFRLFKCVSVLVLNMATSLLVAFTQCFKAMFHPECYNPLLDSTYITGIFHLYPRMTSVNEMVGSLASPLWHLCNASGGSNRDVIKVESWLQNTISSLGEI